MSVCDCVTYLDTKSFVGVGVPAKVKVVLLDSSKNDTAIVKFGLGERCYGWEFAVVTERSHFCPSAFMRSSVF